MWGCGALCKHHLPKFSDNPEQMLSHPHCPDSAEAAWLARRGLRQEPVREASAVCSHSRPAGQQGKVP